MRAAALHALGLGVLRDAARCHDHPRWEFTARDVVAVLLARRWCPHEEAGERQCGDDEPCDSFGAAIFHLRGGRIGVACEASDTTGHGCQCSGTLSVHRTLSFALRLGLTADQARMRGCAVVRRRAVRAAEHRRPRA